MKRSSENIPGKYVPSSLLVPFLLLSIILMISYGIGMKLEVIAVSAGGFAGVMINFIAACNLCYQRGCTDGKKEAAHFKKDVENQKGPSQKRGL